MFILLMFASILLLTDSIKHQAVNLAYLTRPIWDKPMKPFTTINHYFSANLTMKENCELNNFKLANTPSRVYDAILFSVELDLLEVNDCT